MPPGFEVLNLAKYTFTHQYTDPLGNSNSGLIVDFWRERVDKPRGDGLIQKLRPKVPTPKKSWIGLSDVEINEDRIDMVIEDASIGRCFYGELMQ